MMRKSQFQVRYGMFIILYELSYPFQCDFMCFHVKSSGRKLIAVNGSFIASLATAACCSNLIVMGEENAESTRKIMRPPVNMSKSYKI